MLGSVGRTKEFGRSLSSHASFLFLCSPVDYILFMTSPTEHLGNPNEVSDTRYVSKPELQAMFEDSGALKSLLQLRSPLFARLTLLALSSLRSLPSLLSPTHPSPHSLTQHRLVTSILASPHLQPTPSPLGSSLSLETSCSDGGTRCSRGGTPRRDCSMRGPWRI